MSAPRYVRDHSTEQRDCSLYLINVLDPRTKTITLGYVGETGRLPFTRFMEHLYDQPFGDTIVGKPELDPRVFAGKGAVLAAEEEAIKRLRPLYNYEHNLDNPGRVEVWRAREQRDERDRAKGLPVRDWAAEKAARNGASVAGNGSVSPGRVAAPKWRRPRLKLSPRWRRRRNVVAIRGGVWLVFTVAVWVLAARFTPLSAGRTVGPSALATAALMTWAAPHWRRRRGLSRKVCQFLAGLLAAGALLALALLDGGSTAATVAR